MPKLRLSSLMQPAVKFLFAMGVGSPTKSGRLIGRGGVKQGEKVEEGQRSAVGISGQG